MEGVGYMLEVYNSEPRAEGWMEEFLARMERAPKVDAVRFSSAEVEPERFGAWVATQCTVKHLEFHHMDLQHARVQALWEGLHLTTAVQALSLVGCNVDDRMVAQLLSANRGIQMLDLGRNPVVLTAELADACIAAPQLHTLSVRRCHVGGVQIARLVRESSLTSLTLVRNAMGEYDVQSLCAALGENRALRSLCLGPSRSLGEQTWTILFGALARNETLTSLEVDQTARMSRVAESALAAMLECNVGLVHLCVPVHPLWSASGLPALASAAMCNERVQLDPDMLYEPNPLDATQRRAVVLRHLASFQTLLSIFSADVEEALFFQETLCHFVWRELVRLSKLTLFNVEIK